MQNNMDTKIYVPLNKKIEERFGTLKLTVGYTLGGYSYFNSETNPRGIYLYLSPINRNNNGTEHSIMMGSGRSAGYKILLEKFNSRYSGLSNDQKTVLKEYINNITESPKLRDYVNERFKSVKTSLVGISKTIESQATKLKINEVVSLIKHIPKTRNVKDNDILNLLQYLELEKELNNTK